MATPSPQLRQPAPVQGHPQQHAAPAVVPRPPQLIAEGHRRISSFSGLFLLLWPSLLLPPLFVVLLIALLVKSWRTRYRISTHEIEIWEGVFFQRYILIRAGEISHTWMTRSFPEQLTGNATLCVAAWGDAIPKRIREAGYMEVSGLGNDKRMREIAQAVRQSIVAARNARRP